jgi:hypothetical protein
VVKYAVNNVSGICENENNLNGFGIIDKLVLAMRFYNTYGEEPVFNREELLFN